MHSHIVSIHKPCTLLQDVQFTGTTINELKTFCIEKGYFTKAAEWTDNEFELLLDEISKKETVLGVDASTNKAIRIVSVAKPLIYDFLNGKIMVEVFQTFSNKPPKIKASGMSEKFAVNEENARDACARALHEELQISDSSNSLFSNMVLLKLNRGTSNKYPGLVSEYQLYYCMLLPNELQRITAQIPVDKLTPIHEMKGLNPKTMWWCWLSTQTPSDSKQRTATLVEKCSELNGTAIELDDSIFTKLKEEGDVIQEYVQHLCIEA